MGDFEQYGLAWFEEEEGLEMGWRGFARKREEGKRGKGKRQDWKQEEGKRGKGKRQDWKQQERDKIGIRKK